jgi:hypothetical protein
MPFRNIKSELVTSKRYDYGRSIVVLERRIGILIKSGDKFILDTPFYPNEESILSGHNFMFTISFSFVSLSYVFFFLILLDHC